MADKPHARVAGAADRRSGGEEPRRPRPRRGLLSAALACLFLVVGSQAQAQSGDQTRAVQDALHGYIAAMANRRGGEVIRLISRDSLAYYGDMQTLALLGSPSDIAALPMLLDRFLVLSLRHHFPTAELAAFSPEQLVTSAVRRGLMRVDGLRAFGIGGVDLRGDEAMAVLTLSGRATPFRIRFVREDGCWRLDLRSIAILGEPAIRNVVAALRVDENEALRIWLEISTGVPIGPEIWQPAAAVGR